MNNKNYVYGRERKAAHQRSYVWTLNYTKDEDGKYAQIEQAFSALKSQALLLENTQDRPLFFAYKTTTLRGGQPRYFAVRYHNPWLAVELEEIVTMGERVKLWDLYRRWSQNEENYIDSDAISVLSDREYTDNYHIVTQIGLIDTGSRPDHETLKTEFTRRRPRGNAMCYKLNEDKLKESTSDIAKWWKEYDHTTLLEDFQINWYSNASYKEDNEGADPIQSEILREHCLIYALGRAGVDRATCEKIKQAKVLTGVALAHQDFSNLLFENGYYLKTYARQVDRKGYEHYNFNYIPNAARKIDKKHDSRYKKICLMFWEKHWMAYKEIEFKKRKHPFIFILEKMKQEGLISPFNGYDFVNTFGCYSLDKMVQFDDKKYISEMEDGYEYTENELDVPEFKEHSGAENIYFADFEASTDEKFHRPYMCCMKGIVIINHSDIFRLSEEHVYQGSNCAQKMLEYLVNLYPLPEGAKIYRDNTKAKARVYFHNLHYDFTFIMPYLKNVNMVVKGNNLYSATGYYRSNDGTKITKLEFWDSLPIFRCSLKEAVKSYLSPEQQKTIKKEAFPYNLYTYTFFDTHPDGWCTIQEFSNGFSSDDVRQDFLNNTYPTEIVNNGHVNFWKYAEFYCMQDVRCLTEIMICFASLLSGNNVLGIKGNIPFKLSLWEFRTASSIGYEYFLRNVLYKYDMTDKKWKPRIDFYMPKGALRTIVQRTIRGGRVMTRDNEKHYYNKENKTFIQDYDGVSLYPSAMSVLWVTDGKPKFIKGQFSKEDFLRDFTTPEAPESIYKKFNDGCIHLTWINTKKFRHFPLLCVKDPKTKLNHYRNFDNEEIDTWVNAIDLFNLIDFQDADFKWDAAVVWTGNRNYEIRERIWDLFNFRLENKTHQIGTVTKLNMNSIFGKSILKPNDIEKKVVEEFAWTKGADGHPHQTNNWDEFFDQNCYRIHRFEKLEKSQKYLVELYKRDMSSSFNIFGSNVLAMARRIIGRVMSLAEDIEERHPEMTPGLFYTDTDSFQIRDDLLDLLEKEFMEKYGKELKGNKLCQFHKDYDAPKNFKKGENVVGAAECYFIMKKMYGCKLIGDQGSVGFHLRMKGIPTDLVRYEDYKKVFNGESVKYNLLDGHTSFFYEGGNVGSRREMTREIMTSETRKRKREEDAFWVDLREFVNMQERDSFDICTHNSSSETDISDEEVIALAYSTTEPDFFTDDEIIKLARSNKL